MNLNEIFLGKPLHWVLWPVIAIALWLMDRVHLHVTDFNTYMFLVLGIATAVVAILIATTRQGERVTRDPIEGHEADPDWGEE